MIILYIHAHDVFLQKIKKMNYQKIRQNEKQFLSLTSLTVTEFDELLSPFELAWNTFIHKFTLDGKPRTRKYVPKSSNGINSIEVKLFFILCYQKNNPLQEYIAATFDIEQDMCNKWIHILSPLLDKSLEKFKAARTEKELEKKTIEGSIYIGDCTERPIERPTVDQGAVYSGKKKVHSMKNFLLCCTCGFVVFLGRSIWKIQVLFS